MSIQDAARAALALWDGRTVDGMDLTTVMVAIAGAESGWQNNAPGDPGPDSWGCGGFESWGLWQIHMPAHGGMLRQFSGFFSPCEWSQWLEDPDNNARAADAVILGTGQHLPASALHPWTVWFSQTGNPNDNAGDGNGKYRDFLTEAAEAVAIERGEGFPVPPPGDQPGDIVPGPILDTPPPSAATPAGTGLLGVAAVAGLLVGAWLLVSQDQ